MSVTIKNKDIVIFIFTRDLRFHDNTGFNYALKNYHKVIPIFFMTETQISKSNKYRSELAILFMKKILNTLQNKINLFYVKDENASAKILSKIVSDYHVNGVIINRDYSPFAIARESKLEEFCKTRDLQFYKFHDHLLTSDFIMNKATGDSYKKFTPFYSKVLKESVRKPSTQIQLVKLVRLSAGKYNLPTKYNLPAKYNLLKVSVNTNVDLTSKKITYSIKNYKNRKEFPSVPGTKLSVYLHFGVISIRELYYKFKGTKDFIRSLVWRDFYYTYYYNKKDILNQGEYHLDFKWGSVRAFLTKWKSGKTGFPIVDAGMRELNETGFMHNRVRMIVASFLVKDLLINWKEGEKYFSQKLQDIDRVINTGNWQNVIGIAKHSQPYFRVLNPWLQSKKYDKNCEYIKKWVPELSPVSNKDIHNWNETRIKYPSIYLKPIIDHDTSKRNYLKLIKN